MAVPLKVTTMGLAGVNVDKNPLDLADDELLRAQNADSEVVVGRSTLRKRPGLTAFNVATITEGEVLGGSPLPMRNGVTSTGGFRNLYVGRGPA